MSPDVKNSFGKEKRLLRKAQFDAVFQNGRVIRDGQLSVYNCPNGLDYSRLGLMVSKRVGGAVKRNRVKRLLREAFRLNQDRMPGGYDLVVIPRPKYEEDSLAQVQNRLCDLLGRLPEKPPAVRHTRADRPRIRVEQKQD